MTRSRGNKATTLFALPDIPFSNVTHSVVIWTLFASTGNVSLPFSPFISNCTSTLYLAMKSPNSLRAESDATPEIIPALGSRIDPRNVSAGTVCARRAIGPTELFEVGVSVGLGCDFEAQFCNGRAVAHGYILTLGCDTRTQGNTGLCSGNEPRPQPTSARLESDF